MTADPTLSVANLDRLAKIAEHLEAALNLAADNSGGGTLDDHGNLKFRMLYANPRESVRRIQRVAAAFRGDLEAMRELRAQAQEDG